METLLSKLEELDNKYVNVEVDHKTRKVLVHFLDDFALDFLDIYKYVPETYSIHVTFPD